jgi:hypothetical protein
LVLFRGARRIPLFPAFYWRSEQGDLQMKLGLSILSLLAITLFAGCLPERMEEGNIKFRNQSEVRIWVQSRDMGGGDFSCGYLSRGSTAELGYRKGKLPKTMLIKLKW